MPSNTLHQIKIKGFKSIASIDLKLNPINVIIGANGSGKSNFVGAFAFLREIGAGRLKNYVRAAGGAERVLHFGSKTTEKIEFQVEFNYGGFERSLRSAYYLTLAPTADDGLFLSREELYRGPNPISLSEWQVGLEAGISNPAASETLTKGLRRDLDLWQLFHLHDTSYMRKTASVGDNRFLRANGSNLAAFLYYLRMRWVDSYNLIVQSIRQVAPFFYDFEWPREEDKVDDIQLVWRHKGSEQYFNASSLSDGTLRFIALATLFLQPEWHRNSIILVDEPELGLHPYAIELLAALIRQASTTAQVIVSTQSSLLIDHFEPEDVLVADRVNGGTELTHLDSGRLGKWLEDYSLGQLWEKNEFGGQPVSN